MLEAGSFRRIDKEPPGAKRTGFGRKYLAQGKPVYFASFEKGGRALTNRILEPRSDQREREPRTPHDAGAPSAWNAARLHWGAMTV